LRRHIKKKKTTFFPERSLKLDGVKGLKNFSSPKKNQIGSRESATREGVLPKKKIYSKKKRRSKNMGFRRGVGLDPGKTGPDGRYTLWGGGLVIEERATPFTRKRPRKPGRNNVDCWFCLAKWTTMRRIVAAKDREGL